LAQKFDPLVTEWMLFVKTLNYNLIEKCLKLAQLLEYPDLDVNEYVQKIVNIGKSIKLDLTESKTPAYLISMLNEHLFARQGFRGDEEDYYNPKNNFLNDVIDKKSGIPITLSILYTEIAKLIGLDLKIVGFPSHVLVTYRQEMILDPFNGGRLVSVDDLQAILDTNFGGQIEFVPEFLNENSDEQILIRLLRNLRRSYTESYSYDKAMLCTDMALALEPNAPEDIRDKGILEERLLHYETSLKYLNQYLEINPNAEDVDFVLELIKNVRNKINQ
jgi:regulator of sirC expression with transglutaminase-like and TPR domain